MKLRNMNAEVISASNVFVKIDDKETLVDDALIFISYTSKCAIYDREYALVYLLPRYDYSPTTCRQLSAFLEDYCSYPKLSIKDIRKWVKVRSDMPFVLADGYRFAFEWCADFKQW